MSEENGSPDRQTVITLADESSGREEFHRPPTRTERLRAWLEGLPRVRLYVALLLVVWLSLTLLISTDISSQVSGVSTYWTRFLGVGIVVATEMWITWYFLERFGKRILRSNTLIRILLAALLLI